MLTLLLLLPLAHQSLQQVASLSNTALFPNSTSTGLTHLSALPCGSCYLQGEGMPIYWDPKNESYTAETVHLTIVDQNGINITHSHIVTTNHTAYEANNGILTAYNQTLTYPTSYFVGGIYLLVTQQFTSSWSGYANACFTMTRIPGQSAVVQNPAGGTMNSIPLQYSNDNYTSIPPQLQVFNSALGSSYKSSYMTALKSANPALKDCNGVDGWFGDGMPEYHSAVFALTTTTISYIQGSSTKSSSSLPPLAGPTSVSAEPASLPIIPAVQTSQGKASSTTQLTSSQASKPSSQAPTSLLSLAPASSLPAPSPLPSPAPKPSGLVSSPLPASSVPLPPAADSLKPASEPSSASPVSDGLLSPPGLSSTTVPLHSASRSIVASQTLIPGAQSSTASGTAISVAPSGTTTAIGSSTQRLIPVPASSLPAAISIGSQVINANSASQYLVSSQTLVAGSSITIGSGFSTTVIALLTTSGIMQLVIGSDSSKISLTPQVTDSPVLTIGTQAVTANPSSQFIIGGQTVAPGSHPVTVSGTTYSIGVSGSYAVINGATQTLTPSIITPTILLTVGGTPYHAASGSNYVIDGQTLKPNGQITVSGSTVSLGPSASYAVVNGATQTFPSPITTPAPILTVGGTPYSAASGSVYTVGGQILTPNGQITVSGSTISLGPFASYFIINGATQTLTPPTTTFAPILTIGGTPYLPTRGSSYLIFGQTLTPNGQITVSGSTISLAPSASYIVINGATTPLSSPLTTAPPLLTLGGSTYTANSVTQYIIAGQTLSPGAAISMDGTRVSLAEGATNIVVGSSTQSLEPVTETTGLGGYIISGLGGTGSAGFTGSVFTGGARGMKVGSGVWMMCGVGLMGRILM